MRSLPVAVDDAPTLFAPAKLNWSGTWTVRTIDKITADGWLAKYHYLGGANDSSVNYGLFSPDLIAVVSIGEPANASGVAKRYGLEAWPGNKEITRVAVHPESPPNSASRAVAGVCKLCASAWTWLFSYADIGRGHHGGIYQALNAVYVGISPGSAGYLLDGVLTHPRSVVAKFGTRRWPQAAQIAAKRGHRLEKIAAANADKHTYIVPIGPRATRAAIRRALRPHAKPYPKRAAGVEETIPADQPGSVGAMPARRLQLTLFEPKPNGKPNVDPLPGESYEDWERRIEHWFAVHDPAAWW